MPYAHKIRLHLLFKYRLCREQFKAALDLINRQKAEIERLQKENKQFADIGKMYSEIKLEIIKEVTAEIYNSFRQYENYDRHHTFEILNRIESVEELLKDNLVKEMAGE